MNREPWAVVREPGEFTSASV